MKTRYAICLALAAAIPAALPVTASAQGLLPPYEVTTSVRSMGLEPIGRPVLRGNRYVLRAIDGRGVEVRIFADAATGRVLFAKPVGYGREPAYAERSYPPADYPEDRIASPQRNYQPRESYDPRRNYQQQGNYDQQQQAPQNPGEPSVIYAPRGNANSQNITPQAGPKPPSAAKPPAPKVAAKPPAQPAPEAVAQEAPKTEPQRDATNGTAAASPPAPVEKNPALTAPPVQAFE